MNVETNPALSTSGTKGCVGPKHPFVWAALLMIVVLTILYHQAFRPGYVAYSNDGPYGLQAAECNSMPSSFKGVWSDIGWLGNEGIGASPDVRTFLMTVLPLKTYMNVFYPVALFLAGIAVCFCLRQFKLAPIACVLAALAAALNSDFLSTASWGVAPQIIAFAANYTAIGLLAGMSEKRRWARIVLAGLFVGLGVAEGFDNGAIFSLFTAAFALYQALFLQEGSTGKKLAHGVVRIGVIAVFAAFISVNVLSLLVGTQIKGVAGTAQDEETKKMRWAYSTQFSFPEAETLGVVVPGLFGYRNVWHMYDDNQPKDDQYWGTIGAEPPGMWRLTGTGFYAGVLVVVVALWAVMQSFRKRGSPYSDLQRRTIWFWAGVTLVGLLLAYGKFAPFFQFFYALPYASTIRNPVKFMHVFSWALVVLFGYGVHGLAVTYLQGSTAPAQGVMARFKKWRTSASSFERKWMNGLFVAVGLSLLAWFIYAGKSSNLTAYLQTVGISPTDAPGIAAFSLKAVGWFVLFLALTTGLLALIFSGQFAGRAKWAGILMGLLLVVDLGRADAPWIVFYDMNYKFADDPIVNFLGDKPYEHRVAHMQVPTIKTTQEAILQNTYGSHWNQHLFPLHNIQSLEMSQEPRIAVDKDRYLTNLPQGSGLQYVLSNTRYLLGPSSIAKQIDDQTGQQILRNVKTFNFVPKGAEAKPDPVDWIAKEDPNGELAVIEYSQALPRAKLYANWQVITNDDDTLQTIRSGFDPHQAVLVADPIAKPAPGATNPPNDAVKITSYKSKQIELETDAKVPTVLLTVERYHPKWRVWVDGSPAELLRCDFIERGVFLPAGKHKVVFKFEPSMTTFYASLAGVFLGLVLCGWLTVESFSSKSEAPRPTAESPKPKSVQA